MKMKKLSMLFTAFALTGLLFTACSDNDPENEDIRVESVTLAEALKDGVTLFTGKTLDISGQVTVTPSNATDKRESYSSSKTEVATVSQAGLVTAVAEGTSVITITVDGKSASFNLSVVDEDTYVAVTEVVLPDELKDGVDLEVGATVDISGKVTVLPENATVKTESYSSDDEDIATVSEEGIVTGMAAGSATITVTVDGKSASFEVRVTDREIAVESVELDQELKDGLVLVTGETFDISDKYTVLPAGATDKEATYTSGDPSVATIDDQGVITAVAVGTTEIKIAAGGKSASFDVSVIAGGGVSEIVLSADKIDDLMVHRIRNISDLVTVLPAGAANKNVVFSSEDPSIATVDQQGNVTALSTGTTRIVVTSQENPQVTASLELDITAVFSGDYEDTDRIQWEIVDHYLELFIPTSSSELNTTAHLFDDIPQETDTYMGLVKAGQNWPHNGGVNNTGPDAYVQFTIDTKGAHKVNYFRFACRTGLAHLRFMAIERIYGSDDGVNFTEITNDFTDIPNYDDVVTNVTDNAVIKTSTYRYFRFWCKEPARCFPSTGVSAGIRKIWLGYDEALEQ